MPRRRTKKSLSKKRLTKQVRGRGKKSGRRRRSKSRSKRKNNLKGGATSDTRYFKVNSDGSSYTFADNLKKAEVTLDIKEAAEYRHQYFKTGQTDVKKKYDVNPLTYKITQGNGNTINLESTLSINKNKKEERMGFFPKKDRSGKIRLYFYLPTTQVEGPDTLGEDTLGKDTLQKVLISGGIIQELTIGGSSFISGNTFVKLPGRNGSDTINSIIKSIKELDSGAITFTIIRDNISVESNETSELQFKIPNCLGEQKSELQIQENHQYIDDFLSVTISFSKDE